MKPLIPLGGTIFRNIQMITKHFMELKCISLILIIMRI